jgi:hypothetical protein
VALLGRPALIIATDVGTTIVRPTIPGAELDTIVVPSTTVVWIPAPGMAAEVRERTEKTTCSEARAWAGTAPVTLHPVKAAPCRKATPREWTPCRSLGRAGGDQHDPGPDTTTGTIPGERRTTRQYWPSSSARRSDRSSSERLSDVSPKSRLGRSGRSRKSRSRRRKDCPTSFATAVAAKALVAPAWRRSA